MKDKAFELRVFNTDKDNYGLALYQQPLNGQVKQNGPKLVVRAWGTPLQSVTDKVLTLIKGCGYPATSIKQGQTEPLLLDEETGVRMGLLLLAVKPMQKLTRIEEIKDAVHNMGSEEAYYWYSRCTGGIDRERTCRAFRIMVSKE